MNSGRKKVFIIFFIFLILVLLSNIFAYSDKNYKPKYGVTTANLNFRYNTSLISSSKIKAVQKGTRVKMVGEVGGFYIVQLTTNEVGLLSKSYITATSTPPSGASTYTNLAKYYATIDGDNTIVREGPSTSFRKITKLDKGAKVQVIGEISNFYMIITEHNYVGMIRKDLITKTTTTTSNNTTSNNTTNNNTSTTTPSTTIKGVTGSQDEEYILKLLNDARAKKGLKPLVMEANLLRIARIKANDMVAGNYFSHTSPTYGSPFDMMKNNGITYTTAGENIAGNPSLKAAVDAWLASPGHSANIYSTTFNYIGIGIAKSDVYGYVISTMFIGK